MKRLPLLATPLLFALTTAAQTPPPQAPPGPAPAGAPAPQGAPPPPAPALSQIRGASPAAPAPGQAPNGDPASSSAGSLFDNRLPAIDPSGGLLRFNGQTWDINNNAIFRARFEKYLNTPEETGDDERAHREILNKIIALLDPNHLKADTLSDAYRLLARAATYPGDSRLSDTLSNAIYSVWAVKRNQSRMAEANQILEDENKRVRRNLAIRASDENFQPKSEKTGRNSNAPAPEAPPSPPPNAPANPNNPPAQRQGSTSGLSVNGSSLSANLTGNSTSSTPTSPDTSQAQQSAIESSAQGGAKAVVIAGYAQKLVENGVKIKANSLKGDLTEVQAKIEFQSLLVQLFMQRRFHHVVIGSRFYRALFSDGDSKLSLPESSQNPFNKGTGLPPTVSTLESFANEAMRDVQTGVQAFHKLLDLGELRSASERLRDALLIGEFMPEIRTLPFERKRKVLGFVQKANQLLSAIEVKDYTLAGTLLDGPKGLRETAPDFDATKPAALIETARNAARLHLAKARNAAISGDKAGFEAALKEAAAIWPNNPELAEVAGKAFSQGDQMAQALLELDQLIAQKNLRRIADEAGRFLAATQNAPAEKQTQLKQILSDFKAVEASLMAAQEMDRQGNPAGAWESVDKIAAKFPDDLQLNQARALYTTKAADFVRTVQTAQEHERRAEMATGLAWFLKAQRLYPKSDLADEAVKRLKTQLLSESSQ
jgi:hypothetical protein